MRHSKRTKPSYRESDDALDELLRTSLLAEDPRFSRPSSSTIEAYLSGRADEEQRDEVDLAFSRSASFRKEMIERASAEPVSSPAAGDLADLSRMLARLQETFDSVREKVASVLGGAQAALTGNMRITLLEAPALRSPKRGARKRVPLESHRPLFFAIHPRPESLRNKSPVTLAIVDRSEKQVWSMTATAEDIKAQLKTDFGMYGIVVPRASLPPGIYKLTLRAGEKVLAHETIEFETFEP